jgi:hypothetical protein
VRRAVAVLALLIPLFGAGSASACACCADSGTWYEARSTFDATERGELARLRFTTARYVLTPAGNGTPAGAFRVTAALTGRTWRWQIGANGTLVFGLPATAITFATDLHDGKLSPGGGPLLYKELRVQGRLSAEGGLRGTQYRLVLQGRGNNCLNAADFRTWHLDVYGAGARYALYGTFR